MEFWERAGYESAVDYARDRFYDERDDADGPIDPKCGDCEAWTRCNIQGHENVGWCSRWADFFEDDDEWCGD